ncbi:hypothetical protein CAPTEDRAFT_223157 [Capitella teleta]|uniref:DH domain-containing protein n=1 Tax=Capitella teleta TaxID=283909 RepID=R7V2Z8_CAPTE|nr:hypothetical protein CAPTEDRAFT_223157 [Capitella teleta]|eukprot:ELU12944.1 hypothetical protein CAPTEDRAFT_223157 [Capitella teleta]
MTCFVDQPLGLHNYLQSDLFPTDQLSYEDDVIMKTLHSEHAIMDKEESRLAEKLLADLQGPASSQGSARDSSCGTRSGSFRMSSMESEDDEKSEQKEEGLESQLIQLQNLVRDMRESFSAALTTLSTLHQDEDSLYQTVAQNKSTHEHQLADVVAMIITLKSEFNTVVGQLQTANSAQRELELQVSSLRLERDELLQELEKNGTVSSQLRVKYNSMKILPTNLNRTHEGSHLSLLLEKAHNAFNNSVLLNQTCPPNFISSEVCETANNSDHDSGCQTARQESSPSSCGDASPTPERRLPRSSLPMSPCVDMNRTVELRSTEEAADSDSDSSVRAAANRSLDLSRSVGNQCGLDGDEEVDVDSCPSVPPVASPVKLSSKPTTPHRLAPHERLSKIAARQRVIEELIETERTYCSALWCVMQDFASPVADSGLASEAEFRVIFPNSLDAIYEHHCSLLRQLEDRLHSSSANTGAIIGDIMAKAFESQDSYVLQEYQSYVTAFPNALHQLHTSCRNSPALKALFRKLVQDKNSGAMDVTAFMLTPIQRIPRYVLLLKQVLRQSPSEHPDSYNLEKCVTFLASFLTQLNDSMQQSMQLISKRNDKPKRKLRLGSFRSLSHSNYDSKPKVEQQTPRIQRPLSAANDSRALQLSSLRDSLVQNKLSSSLRSGPFLAPPTSTPCQYAFNPDQSISTEKRRFPRSKRPKSTTGTVNMAYASPSKDLSLSCSRIEADETFLKPRPKSMMESSGSKSSRLLVYSSEESLNTDTMSSVHFSNDVSRYEFHDDDDDTLNGSIPDLPMGASATSTLSRSEQDALPIKPHYSSEACLSPDDSAELSVCDDSVLSQSACDLSVMNATLTAATTANRSFLKWRRRKKGSEIFTDSIVRKRPSFRESIRNLFVRKRNSKGSETDSTLSAAPSMESLPTVTAVRPANSPKEQGPPAEPSIVVNPAECDTTLDLQTFEDENECI